MYLGAARTLFTERHLLDILNIQSIQNIPTFQSIFGV